MPSSRERLFDTGPGWIGARVCAECGHTRCGPDCDCDCDLFAETDRAEAAESDAAAWKKRASEAEAEVARLSRLIELQAGHVMSEKAHAYIGGQQSIADRLTALEAAARALVEAHKRWRECPLDPPGDWALQHQLHNAVIDVEALLASAAPRDSAAEGKASAELFTPEMVEAIQNIIFDDFVAWNSVDEWRVGRLEWDTVRSGRTAVDLERGLTREQAIRRAFELSRGGGNPGDRSRCEEK